jgi:hypothetical protein
VKPPDGEVTLVTIDVVGGVPCSIAGSVQAPLGEDATVGEAGAPSISTACPDATRYSMVKMSPAP